MINGAWVAVKRGSTLEKVAGVRLLRAGRFSIFGFRMGGSCAPALFAELS